MARPGRCWRRSSGRDGKKGRLAAAGRTGCPRPAPRCQETQPTRYRRPSRGRTGRYASALSEDRQAPGRGPIRRSARVSGYRAGRYLLSVTAPVLLERCHPADPGRRAREAVAAAHKLTVSANSKWVTLPEAASPSAPYFTTPPARRSGHQRRLKLSGSQLQTAAAGNEVGITSARGGSRGLPPAHLCTSVTCGNTQKTLVAGMWMHSWGSRGRGFM